LVLDIPRKFITQYQGHTFTQILSKYPLKKINDLQLCPMTQTGFLHDKFVIEVRSRKLEFLKGWKSDELLYTSLMSPEMYSALVEVKRAVQLSEDTYQQKLKDLHLRYSERTEIQQKEYAEKERKIPIEAKKFAQQVSSKAKESALNQAAGNAAWDGNTRNVLRDSSTGFAVAEAARKSAEQAAMERMRQELQQESSNPITVARGALQQRKYEEEKQEALDLRNEIHAELQITLEKTLSM
jgi:hypothetical protein